MNAEDAFEKRLRATPPRQIPASWHNDILEALPEAPRKKPVPRPGIGDFLRAVFWAQPKGWSSLGAAWLLILGLNLTSQEPADAEIARLAPPSPQMRELLRQQEQLMAELSDSMDFSELQKRQPVSPKPQSCLQWETFNT